MNLLHYTGVGSAWSPGILPAFDHECFFPPDPPPPRPSIFFYSTEIAVYKGGPNWREASMEYFMVPAQKVPSLQHFRKTEKEVIGGLCRYVWGTHAQPPCVYYCCYKAYVWSARTQRRRRGNMLDLICYCVHDPTRGRLWPSITGKHWNYLTSDQCGAPGLISTTPLM